MDKMFLFHTGYEEIRNPDIHYGRKNADFGQGFYLTADLGFSKRWARERQGKNTYVNSYVLDPDGLQIHYFNRNEAWFDYIFGNRHGKKDALPDADVIIGPIANDTIYDTLGITTSGFLNKEEALKLLMIGSLYEQVVIKTDRALMNLLWTSASLLNRYEIESYRRKVQKEEDEYLALFSAQLESME